MKKLTFEQILERYREIIAQELDRPYFNFFYITDNNCEGTKEKPFKLKLLCSYILPLTKNENGKYQLVEEEKIDFLLKLIETYKKEKIYKL